MMRMSGGGLACELGVTANAHLVRVLLELERSVVGWPAVVVRIVTASATGVAFAKTLRALESFDDKSALAEAPIFEEALARELSIGRGGVT